MPLKHIKSSLIFLITVFLGFAQLVHAQWATLDGVDSSISFVSVKNKDISEVHGFASITGSISDQGSVQISIDPASLNTGIQIRDQRMKEHLFAIVEYPEIEISAQVDLDQIQPGVQRLQLPASLSLVGQELPVVLDVLVASTETDLVVSSAKPVVIYASQAGLTEGIAKLAELAGDISIGHSTSVSFVLSFKR